MSNIKFNKEILDSFSSCAPLVYVGYQKNPKSKEMDGWLREGEELPGDVFRVMIRQQFPIITNSGQIDTSFVSHYIYVGRVVDVLGLMENSDLLKDEVRESLLNSMRCAITSLVVCAVSERYNEEDNVYMYPMENGDYQVSNINELREVVKTISDLHGNLIQKPINDQIKVYRKTL